MFMSFMAHGLLKDCVCLLGMFDVDFENVCFAHRALTRPLGTTTTTNNNNNNTDNNSNNTTNNNKS